MTESIPPVGVDAIINEFQEDETIVVMPFTTGAFFADRYQVDKMIGQGAMGNIYKATDLTEDTEVALKVLQKRKHSNPEALARFQQEAKILSSMSHPGIVAIHDFGEAPDGTPYLAMELLVGETLRERILRDGPINIVALRRVLLATAEALSAAHELGVLHRDLKPDNIYLPDIGRHPVKVLDFGLSRMGIGGKLTRAGALIGTPRYMAPEVIRSVQSADERADVYALGVIAYEALAGSSPFAASDQRQMLGRIIAGKRKPLREVRPDLNAPVENVLNKAMAKEPQERYASPLDFAHAFARATGAAGEIFQQRSRSRGASLAPTPSQPEPTVKPSPPAKRPGPSVLMMVVIGSIGFIIGAALVAAVMVFVLK